MDNDLQRIMAFLSHIGLQLQQREITEPTFLPGIKVEDGALIVDPERVKYPGDLLHEAGHLALLSPQQRENWNGDFTGAGGYEIGAIAWSYAACIELGLPVALLFHDDGYKGDARWLIEVFTEGTGMGVPMLEWLGLTTANGETAFPQMTSWLCMEDMADAG